MNKILNINLGGYALTIDDDAYEHLSAYLDNIRKRFSESEGRDEIIHDIEMRLGELISQNMGSKTIVMLPDVEAAIKVMGNPEDFGGEAPDPKKAKSSGKFSSGIKPGKRLFRDEEDRVAGGVCSGLAAYFGFSDPVWMRLIFVLLTFVSGGFWLPAYILMWIVVPPAKTAADRLAMRGEQANINNIAKEVEEGFERLTHQFSPDARRRGQNAVAAGISIIGQIFAFMVRFFVRFGFLIAILALAAIFIGLSVAWVVGIWDMFAKVSVMDFFSPFSGGVTWLAFTNLFFLIIIPLFGLCLVFARFTFKSHTPAWLSAGLGIFWAFNLISAIILTAFASNEYRKSSTLSKSINLMEIRSDTLRIETSDLRSKYDYDDNFHIGIEGDWFSMQDERVLIDGPYEIWVEQSETDRFECTQHITSHGSTNAAALENAGKIEFNVSTSGRGTLMVPNYISIPKGNKWKGQSVKLKINVPVGKYVVFGKKINERARASDYEEEENNSYLNEQPDRVFRMTSKGLVCNDCPQFGDRNYHGRDYQQFIIHDNIDTEIRKGDNFSIRVEGSEADKKLVQTIRSGDQISVSTQGKLPKGKLKLLIETRDISFLNADNTGDVTIWGFDLDDMRISAKGNSKIKANMKARDLTISLAGKCSLELTGTGNEMTVGLRDGALLDGSAWQVENAVISAYENSNGQIFVNNDVVLKTDLSSHVTIDGKGKINKTDEQ
jgi:phage shock protein PspC (stress-responsive transcriptional regulator)